MKKLMNTLLAAALMFSLTACGSSTAAGQTTVAPEAAAKTDEDFVTEVATSFLDALKAGDVAGAMKFATSGVEDAFNIPELQAAKDEIKGIGFSEKSEQEFADFIDTIMPLVFKEGFRSFNLGSPVKVSDSEYTVKGTAEIVNFETALDFDFDSLMDDDLSAQISDKAASEGPEAALEFAMTEIISRLNASVTERLQTAPTEMASVNLKVVKENDEWKIADMDGLVDAATTAANTPVTATVVFDSNGISFPGGDGWYQLSGSDAQGSTFAAQNDNYNGTVVQIHFTEQPDQGMNQKQINDYVNNQLLNEIKTNYEAGGYESCTTKAITVNGFAGALAEGHINGNVIYELDVPVLTGNGNLTMIAILCLTNDETVALFNELTIK